MLGSRTAVPRESRTRARNSGSELEVDRDTTETDAFKVIVNSQVHDIPRDAQARIALARRLCQDHGGSVNVLGKLLSKPVDSMVYNSLEIRGPKGSCDSHRHLFDAEGSLHCFLPNAVQFGSRLGAGMSHGKNLTPVLTGVQSQCGGWRTDLELLLSPQGEAVQAFVLHPEARKKYQ